jgi:ferredoxin
MEEGMLEIACEPRANSRLSCQVHIDTNLEGLEVVVPKLQRQ